MMPASARMARCGAGGSGSASTSGRTGAEAAAAALPLAVRGRRMSLSSSSSLLLPRSSSSSSGIKRRFACRATGDDAQNERIKTTLADLDALLGIQEEPKAADKDVAAANAAAAAAGPLSPEALQAAVTEEMQRLVAKEGTARSPELEGVITEQMQKILERAKALADEQSREASGGGAAAPGGGADGQKQALRREFEELLNTFFSSQQGVDKADMQRLRESGVFGPLSFWVTEMRNLQDPSDAMDGGGAGGGGRQQVGYLVRGNLRRPRLEVYEALCAKTRELFGGKYEVLMIEDPEAGADGDDAPVPRPRAPPANGAAGSSNGSGAAAAAGGGEEEDEVRIAFQIVPAALAVPPQSGGWQAFAAGALLLLFFAACVQLSLVANITKLPRETLEYFANADNAASDALPPGLESWDPAPYLACALPVFAAVVGVNFLHEVGHRLAARARGVKLGPTYFIPNLQVGSFGAITPIASLLKGRRDLWDVAAAGPIAGGLASAALLVVGLQQSQEGGLPPELLIPVPAQLFQGSLLLGAATRAALGEAAMARADVLISPLVIAGWCGLITTSLNLLPVGSLDGGRMVQAAFGGQALSLSSFFTYVGLGLGLLGSSLSLPFGLYVLICQRTAERYIKDSVTGVGSAKQAATAVAVLTAILVLLPMAPELSESMGVGPTPNLFM